MLHGLAGKFDGGGDLRRDRGTCSGSARGGGSGRTHAVDSSILVPGRSFQRGGRPSLDVAFSKEDSGRRLEDPQGSSWVSRRPDTEYGKRDKTRLAFEIMRFVASNSTSAVGRRKKGITPPFAKIVR